MNFKVTTLIENKPDENNTLLSEHGLSLYIEFDGIKILFDTGQSGSFIDNADKLNIDLKNIDYVVLSHGHYDHSGGFRRLVEKIGTSFNLIVGKGFFNKKYKLTEEGTYKYNGNSFDKVYIRQNNIQVKYINEDIFNITDNILVFSDFKRNNDFELINNKFHIRKNENFVIDDFSDEIILAFKLDKGLVVILGCSHVGVVNILETIIERTEIPIYGIVGGTHLIKADNNRINNTIKFLKEKDIRILRMSHCTGDKAIEEIKLEFGERFLYSHTGSVIEFDDNTKG